MKNGHDGNTPSDAEKNQMNVYVTTGGSACESITEVGIAGPSVGFTNTLHLFNAVSIADERWNAYLPLVLR